VVLVRRGERRHVLRQRRRGELCVFRRSPVRGHDLFKDGDGGEYGPRVENGDRFSDLATVTVAYNSLDSFGADYEEIHAYVAVRTHRTILGRLEPTDYRSEGQTITLVRSGRRFVGSVPVALPGFPGDSVTRLDGIDVAVSNDQGTWDSNNSANYRLNF
jgi:hypothetical protein